MLTISSCIFDDLHSDIFFDQVFDRFRDLLSLAADDGDRSADGGILHDGDIGENDVDLTEFIVESIMFISFIVELEDKLGIEIPEELLDINSIKSLNTFSTILEELLK